jgi:hypothetical protein
MPDVGIIYTIAGGLFGPVFLVVLLVVAAVGVLLGGRLPIWPKLVLAGIGAISLLLWLNYFLFPYPPGSSEPTWMFSGWEYTEPASTLIEMRPPYKTFSKQRLNGELVAAFGGDVEQVWMGSSMEVPKYLGQFAIIVVLLAVSAMVPIGRAKKED